MSSDLVIAQNAGMDAYLTKPFHREELYEVIAKFDVLSQRSVVVVEESNAASHAVSQKLTFFSRTGSVAPSGTEVVLDGTSCMVLEVTRIEFSLGLTRWPSKKLLTCLAKKCKSG